MFVKVITVNEKGHKDELLIYDVIYLHLNGKYSYAVNSNNIGYKIDISKSEVHVVK